MSLTGKSRIVSCPADFILYPNPSNDFLNIEFETEIDSIEYEIRLFNKQNKLEYSIKTNKKLNLIDVKHLPPDLYFIHIIFNQTTIRKKIWIIK